MRSHLFLGSLIAIIMLISSSIAVAQLCDDPPGAQRVNDDYLPDPNGYWWLITNYQDTNSDGLIRPTDYFNFPDSFVSGPVRLADPTILRAAYGSDIWYYITGTSTPAENFPIYRTRDFRTFELHMWAFDDQNRNGSGQWVDTTTNPPTLHIGSLSQSDTYTYLWSNQLFIDPDYVGANPPVYFVFSANENSTSTDDTSSYFGSMSLGDFQSWHNLNPANDGPRFLDQRVSGNNIKESRWFGYEPGGPGTGFVYDGGHAAGRWIPCTSSISRAGPNCGDLELLQRGANWRCVGAISTMYVDAFTFVDPKLLAGQPWRQSVLYSWLAEDPTIWSGHWGQHIAAATTNGFGRFRQGQFGYSMAFCRNVNNPPIGGLLAGGTGPFDNGASDVNGNEANSAIAEGVCAFYNEQNDRYYIIYSRNLWSSPAYQMVYRKSAVGASFLLLQLPAWDDRTIAEQRLLRGTNYTSATPQANNYGNGDVFWIKDSLTGEKLYYLICHVKVDNGTRRTILIKELFFNPSNGNIIELLETSTDPRRDVRVFRIPVCRDHQSCMLDVDEDGIVGVPDMFAFLSAWFAVTGGNTCASLGCIADWDRSGVVDVPDIFAYQSSWFAVGAGNPCP